jgi:hypothetical protein
MQIYNKFGYYAIQRTQFLRFFATFFDTYLKKANFVINHHNYETTNQFAVALGVAAGGGAG